VPFRLELAEFRQTAQYVFVSHRSPTASGIWWLISSFNKVNSGSTFDFGRYIDTFQVNDMYYTNSQTLEFRHSLFRRGEPQSLPQIKRKSIRHAASHYGHRRYISSDESNEGLIAGMAIDRGYRPLSSFGQSSGRVYGHVTQTRETSITRASSKEGESSTLRANLWNRDRDLDHPHDQGRSYHQYSDRPRETCFHPDLTRPRLPAHCCDSCKKSNIHGQSGVSSPVGV
jgi:hypothetical protein